MKKKTAVTFLLCLMICLFLPISYHVRAADSLLPSGTSNLTMNLISTSSLTATESGYMRVFYDGSKVNIEYYDDNFQILRKSAISMELSIWGGFYAGSDAYYLVEGENNTQESDTAEVIRVIKYDTEWKRVGAANITGNTKLFGGQVRYPFNYGCVEFAESGSTLYVVTGHEGYVDEAYNQGHQGFLMIRVDEASMEGQIVDCDLWHSFAQYIENKDSNLYVLEQSEGSRYTKLTKYSEDTLDNSSIAVLEYGGSRTSAWAIACYATVDDMALSSDSVLCLGTSIDQSGYDNATHSTPYNIYLTVTPMENFSQDATSVKWITSYTEEGKYFYGTKLTKVTDDRFLISWQEYRETTAASIDDTLSANVLHYLFVDGQGNPIGQEFTAAAALSDCHPVVKGSKIVYYAASTNMVNFYMIDANTGSFSKKSYPVAGEGVSWSIKNQVLTISGTGSVNVENAWDTLRDQVKKIVIETGITHIGEEAFACLTNLTEVEIQDGLQSIGDRAFFSCTSLKKITIPASVTAIGEDILWTSYMWIYDGSHVVDATIYTEEGSFAASYAAKNGIACKNLNGKKITSSDSSENSSITLKKVTLSRVTSPKKGTIRVTWKKSSGARGYEIQCARNAKFTKSVRTITVKKASVLSKKIAKLKKGKKYYVRVRAYAVSGGTKKYGAWSRTKSVKCR